ncbi:hypothetical protein Bca52824_029926 [Brassica carinata]|uniref:Uncharacterized protein n=1 Tax=Brassica carinata TaxID=52824 RepID=A0A8X7V2Q8_BRACI|nr:hypothetical protein Bca52824_029926 [Brassica carinata]
MKFCAMGPRISADAVMVRAVVGNELAQSLKPNRIMSVSRLMWPSLVSDVVILCSVYIMPRPGEFKIEQQKLRAIIVCFSADAKGFLPVVTLSGGKVTVLVTRVLRCFRRVAVSRMDIQKDRVGVSTS